MSPVSVTALRRVPLGQRFKLNSGEPLRILVTGYRLWRWPQVIHDALTEVALGIPIDQLVLVHGRGDPYAPGFDDKGKPVARMVRWRDAYAYDGVLWGADWIAHRYAEEHHWGIEPHPADWGKYGNRAGPLRNGEMVQRGADMCLGFPCGESKGTRGTLRMAVAARIPIRTYEG
jgi:hypothetical protein